MVNFTDFYEISAKFYEFRRNFSLFLVVFNGKDQNFIEKIDFSAQNHSFPMISEKNLNKSIEFANIFFYKCFKLIIIDNITKEPITSNILINSTFLMNIITKSNKNLFGAIKLAFLLRENTINSTIFRIEIFSDFYRNITFSQEIELFNKISLINLGFLPLFQKKILYNFMGKVVNFFNISKNLANVSVTILSRNISFIISTNSSGFFVFSSEFFLITPINFVINLTKSHYKPIFRDIWIKNLIFHEKAEKTIEMFAMFPRKIKGKVSGFIPNFSETSIKLEILQRRPSIFFYKTLKNLTKSSNSSIILNKTSLKTGFFSMKFSLDPTRSPYITFLTINNPFYQTFSSVFLLQFSNNFSRNFPEIVLSLKNSIFITIFAVFEDYNLENSAIKGVKIIANVTQEKKGLVFSMNFSENSTNGVFFQNFSMLIYDEFPLNYTISLEISKKTYIPLLKTQSFSLENSSISSLILNFSAIILEHTEKTSLISGFLYDEVLNSSISSAIVISTMTCIDSNELQMIQVSSDENGDFAIESQIYEGFTYSVVLTITMQYFQSFSLDLSLNITNNYNIILGGISLPRSVSTAIITGILIDFTSKKPLILWGIYFENLKKMVFTDSAGAFNVTFTVFEGLEYDENIFYPLSFSNETNSSVFSANNDSNLSANSSLNLSSNSSINLLSNSSMNLSLSNSSINLSTNLSLNSNLSTISSLFYVKNTNQISLTLTNKYISSLGDLYCKRKNQTSSVTIALERDFSIENSLFFSLILNLTACETSYFFQKTLVFLENSIELSYEYNEILSEGLNYTGNLLLVSDTIDSFLLEFLLNSQNNYTINLGLVTLQALTEKTTIMGQILDNSDDSVIANVLISLMLYAENYSISAYSFSDTNGNFSVTAKLTIISATNTSTINYSTINDSAINDSAINNSTINVSMINSSDFSYFATLKISKLFYKPIELDFWLNSSLNSSINGVFIIEFGVIRMTHDYIEGLIYGMIFDVILNKILSLQRLQISISESENSLLISLNDLYSDANGRFSLFDTFKKGVNYTIKIEISEVSEFQIFSEDFSLSFENNYMLDVRIFMMRVTVFINIKGVLIDNYTRNVVSKANVSILISFKRDFLCVLGGNSQENNSKITNENSDICEGVDFFEDFIGKNENLSVFYDKNESFIKINIFNFTNDLGIFQEEIELWTGISYFSEIKLIKSLYIDENFTICVNSSNNYEGNYGQMLMYRNRVSGVFIGLITDKLFGISLKKAVIQGKVYLENEDFGVYYRNSSDFYGKFVVFVDNLLEGLDYSLTIITQKKFFVEFSNVIAMNYSEKFGYFNEKNITLQRKTAFIRISGQIISKINRNPLFDVKIMLNITIFNESVLTSAIYSDKKGFFIEKIAGFYEGLNYSIILQLFTAFPYENMTKSLYIFMRNSSISRNFNNLLINTQKTLCSFSGKLLDFNDKTAISNANITFLLINSDTNCSNQSNCTKLRVFGKSDNFGMFLLMKKVFLMENYEFFVKIKADFYNKKKKISGFLNISNNYSLEKMIFLQRKRAFANITAIFLDNLTNKTVENYRVLYEISYNFANFTDNNQINFTGEFFNFTGNFSENLMVYLGRIYTVFLTILKPFYEDSFRNFTLSMNSNYSIDLGAIFLMRKTKEIEISGLIYDNLTGLGVRNTLIKLVLSPYFGFFYTFSNKTGNFSRKIAIYEGLSYLLKISLKNKEFLSKRISVFIAKKSNSSINYYNFSLIRKNTTFYIAGSIIDENGDNVNKAKIKAIFLLNPLLNISDILYETKSNSSGFFEIYGEIPNFLEINCTIKIKKSGFSTKKIKTKLRKLLNYSLIMQESIVLTSQTTTETGEIGLKVSDSTEKITFQVISHSFCMKNSLIYVINATIWLENQGKILSKTFSDSNGIVILEAPLVFYGVVAASYSGVIQVEKEGFYSKEIVVAIGGNSWETGINLGEIELIQEKC